MSNFTPEEIQEILDLYFENFAHRQYIGARYVPIFGRKGETSIEWDNSAPYEPLTIVLHEGNSYTSRQFVPTGVAITNNTYWAETGNFNAQVEQYRQEVRAVEDIIPIGEFSAENTVKAYIDTQINSVNETIRASLGKTFINVLNPPNDLDPLDNTGVNDNASKLQAIIDSLDSGYGGMIYFPTGIYLFENTVNVTHDKITLFGDNYRGTRIHYVGNSTLFNVTPYSSTPVGGTYNNESFVFCNLFFHGESQDETATCIYTRDTLRVNMIHCFVFGFHVGIDYATDEIQSVGSSLFEDVTFGFSANESTGLCFKFTGNVNSIEIDSCGGNMSGNKFIYSSLATDIWLRNVNIANGGDTLLQFVGASAGKKPSDIKITDCIFDSNNGVILKMANLVVWGTAIINNWFNFSTGIANTPSAIVLNNCSFVKIADNQFGGSIHGDTTPDAKFRGILTDTSTDCIISNNVFEESFIGIAGNFNRCIVSGNRFVGFVSANVTNPTAIQQTGEYTTIQGNVCTGYASGVSINCTGTSNLVHGNITDKALSGSPDTTSANLVIS